MILSFPSSFFFFTHTPTPEISTLSLHDALPIDAIAHAVARGIAPHAVHRLRDHVRSEEHTSELQSPMYLVCRLLLEKKKNEPIQRETHTNKNNKTHKEREKGT